MRLKKRLAYPGAELNTLMSRSVGSVFDGHDSASLLKNIHQQKTKGVRNNTSLRVLQ